MSCWVEDTLRNNQRTGIKRRLGYISPYTLQFGRHCIWIRSLLIVSARTEGSKSNIPCCALLPAAVARNICMMYADYIVHDAHRTRICVTCDICAKFTPDARVASANPTQMLRAPAAWGARNKGCYFWTALYVHCTQTQIQYWPKVTHAKKRASHVGCNVHARIQRVLHRICY
jgi:hypothetical protein